MRKRPLQCPFCDNLLASPVDIKLDVLEITGGICKCSAVYVLDLTGHNLGAIFMDALYFACNEDYDKALSLMPEEYETVTFDYDPYSNTAIPSQDRSTQKTPRLLFLRLKEKAADNSSKIQK